jgi:hypothetical protein
VPAAPAAASTPLRGRPPEPPNNCSDRRPAGRHGCGRRRGDGRPADRPAKKRGAAGRPAAECGMAEYGRAACPLPPACALPWPRREYTHASGRVRPRAKRRQGGGGRRPVVPPSPGNNIQQPHTRDVARPATRISDVVSSIAQPTTRRRNGGQGGGLAPADRRLTAAAVAASARGPAGRVRPPPWLCMRCARLRRVTRRKPARGRPPDARGDSERPKPKKDGGPRHPMRAPTVTSRCSKHPMPQKIE